MTKDQILEKTYLAAVIECLFWIAWSKIYTLQVRQTTQDKPLTPLAEVWSVWIYYKIYLVGSFNDLVTPSK